MTKHFRDQISEIVYPQTIKIWLPSSKEDSQEGEWPEVRKLVIEKMYQRIDDREKAGLLVEGIIYVIDGFYTVVNKELM